MGHKKLEVHIGAGGDGGGRLWPPALGGLAQPRRQSVINWVLSYPRNNNNKWLLN